MNNSPLITAASWVTGVTLLLNLLIAYGLPITPEQRAATVDFVAFAGPILAAVAVAWYGHKNTTSLSNPIDVDGQPLTRADGSPAIKAK